MRAPMPAWAGPKCPGGRVCRNDERTTRAAISDPFGRNAAEVQNFDAAGRRAVDAEDYAASRAAFERELALRREIGDRPGVVFALFHVAWVMRFGQGEIAAARPLLEEALAVARDLDSPLHIGTALANLGDLALDE